MSVIIADGSVSTDEALAGYPGFGLVGFTVQLARELGQEVIRQPVEGNPAHCLVRGPKTGAVRRRLARECRWIVEPENPVAQR